MLIAQCSSTLAGLKTGTLFPYRGETREELVRSLRSYNKRLVPKGLRLIMLSYEDERALLYMYRPKSLERDLEASLARRMLEERSYPAENPAKCVATLARRMQDKSAFPHEVGLFLGYPAEDVDGFIRNGARDSVCVGTWKVYGDPAAARRKFSQYKKCSEVYRKCYQRDRSFDRLAVKTI